VSFRHLLSRRDVADDIHPFAGLCLLMLEVFEQQFDVHQGGDLRSFGPVMSQDQLCCWRGVGKYAVILSALCFAGKQVRCRDMMQANTEVERQEQSPANAKQIQCRRPR
jgi:hypothetical protein